MAQGKSFGNIMSLVLICGTIVVLGTLGLTFAFLYKVLIYGYFCPNFDRDEDEPVPGLRPASSTTTVTNGTVPVSRPPVTAVPENGDIESHVSEVAAIVIPIKMKMPKHERDIVTPRATVLDGRKVYVDAVAYESDIESQRSTSRAYGCEVDAGIVDHLAPAWEDDSDEEIITNSLTTSITVTTAATGAGISSTAVRQSRTHDVVLDHRAPDWYND